MLPLALGEIPKEHSLSNVGRYHLYLVHLLGLFLLILRKRYNQLLSCFRPELGQDEHSHLVYVQGVLESLLDQDD